MRRSMLVPSVTAAVLLAGGAAHAGLTLLENGTGQDSGFFQLSALDAQHAMAVGTHDRGDGNSEAVIKVTTNGGTTWATYKPTSGSGGPFDIEMYTSVEMVTTERAYVGAMGKLWVTSNGGGSWTAYTESGWSLLTGPVITGVSFVDASTGYLAGSSGFLRKTTDGGATWPELTGPATLDWAGVRAIGGSVWLWAGSSVTDPDTGDVIGYEDGAFARSTDGGATWSMIFEGEARTVQPFFLDAQEGWIVSMSTAGPRLEHTTDGGATFVDLPLPSGAAGAPDAAWAVAFFDRCEGILLAEREEQPMVFHTVDEGVTWTELDTSALEISLPIPVPFPVHPRLFAADFPSREVGFLGGSFEALVKYTADGAGPGCGGTPTDGGLPGDGDGGTGGADDEEGGGCGCRAGGRPAAGVFPALLVALAALGPRRRVSPRPPGAR